MFDRFHLFTHDVPDSEHHLHVAEFMRWQAATTVA
jgi:hypothetical protein